MLLADSGIALDFPANWNHFSESGRVVFQSPRREEVMVSASRLISSKKGDASASLLDRMIENGLTAARMAATIPELRVTKALGEETHSTMRCWTIFAETHSRDTFFGQAILAHASGVVLLTYEAPFAVEADQEFRRILGLVRLP